MTLFYLIIVAIVAAAASWFIFSFNRLITLRNRCRNQWAQIDVDLKLRHELIPSLLDVVTAYASHERNTIERVTRARTTALASGAGGELASSEDELTGSIRSLFAVTEGYPDLKADSTFLELQDKLTEIEERIRFSRQFYNDTVMRYNTMIDSFPSIIIARVMNFTEENFFRIE